VLVLLVLEEVSLLWDKYITWDTHASVETSDAGPRYWLISLGVESGKKFATYAVHVQVVSEYFFISHLITYFLALRSSYNLGLHYIRCPLVSIICPLPPEIQKKFS
jgi:hypothetical protein